MTHIKEGQTFSFQQAPNELQELVRHFVRMCTFRQVPVSDWEHLPVQLTRQGEGWLFVCRVCPHMECTGFIRDKLKKPPTKRPDTVSSKS